MLSQECTPLLTPSVIQELHFISQLVEILDVVNFTALTSDDEETVLKVLEQFFCGSLSVDDSALLTLLFQHEGTEEEGKMSAFIACHQFIPDT